MMSYNYYTEGYTGLTVFIGFRGLRFSGFWGLGLFRV